MVQNAGLIFKLTAHFFYHLVRGFTDCGHRHSGEEERHRNAQQDTGQNGNIRNIDNIDAGMFFK